MTPTGSPSPSASAYPGLLLADGEVDGVVGEELGLGAGPCVTDGGPGWTGVCTGGTTGGWAG
ncbi:hypothetical protein ACFQ0M_30535 [Kitasatospora aburaviensis]